MINPLKEVNTLKEMNELVGYKVPVLEKEVDLYIVIMEHARIKYKDGSEFDMEYSNEDISGISGGNLIKEEVINDINVEYYIMEDIYYILWKYNGYSYSYSNRDVLDSNEINRLIELTRV